MKRFLSLIAIALSCFAPVASAQWVTVTANNIQNGSGTLLASGQFCVQPVDNYNHPLTARVGGTTGGAIVTSQACGTVTNGVLASAYKMPDTSITSPVNTCFRVTIKDNSQNGAPVYIQPCVQPSSTSTASSWCTTSGTTTCNFDLYNPNVAAQVVVTPGAAGAAGPAGPTGPSPTFSIGTVSTGTPAVTLTGTALAPVLNITLPTGSAFTPLLGTTAPTATCSSTTNNLLFATNTSTGALYQCNGPVSTWISVGGGSATLPASLSVVQTNSLGVASQAPVTGSGSIVLGTSPSIAVGNLTMGALSTIAIVGTGDSRMCGSTLYASACGASGLTNAGGNGNQDLISRLAQQPQYLNRAAYVFNGARGGSTCTTMTTDYTGLGVNTYKPGGSNAPLATRSDLYIMDSENDISSNTTGSLQTFENCMGAYLNQATSDGFSPIILTSYSTATDTDALNSLMQSYNNWLLTLDGTVANGKTIKVIDVDAAFPWNLGAGVQNVGVAAGGGTLYPITSYSITNASGVSTITFVTTQTTGNTALLPTYPNMELGTFPTSTFLNYQHATYLSGAGTQTITATLSYPFPTRTTTTEAGLAWSWSNPAVPGGKHMAPDGVLLQAKFVNNRLALGLGSLDTKPNTQEYFNPPTGIEMIAGGLCVTGAVNAPYASKCYAPAKGNISMGATAQNLTPTQAGYYAGSGYVYLGHGTGTYIGFSPSALTFQAATYTGASGAVGYVTVTAGGTGYTVGDSITISGGGSGTAVVTVLAVNGSGCTIAVGCVGPVTLLNQPSSAANAGSGYSQTSGVATTDTTNGAATGLTVSTYLSASQAMSFAANGFVFGGGSLRAAGRTVSGYLADTAGEVASAVFGGMGGLSVVSGTSATGCYITGDVVTIGGGASNGTGTVTATSCTVSAVAVTTAGAGYSYTGSPSTTTGGSGTGLTVQVTSITSGGGRFRFGNNYYCQDNGVAANCNFSGTFTVNQAITSTGTVQGATLTATGAATVGTTLGVTGASTLAAATFSGMVTHSAAGAASASPLYLTGAVYSGGTGTTDFPEVFLQPTAATAATTWSTAGTFFGVNAGSGFTGNMIDFHVNGGTSALLVNYQGNLTTAGSINSTNVGTTAVSTSGEFQGKGYGDTTSFTPAAGAALGTSPTIACATSVVCGWNGGTINIATGTATATGVAFTITDSFTHAHLASCDYTIYAANSSYVPSGTIINTGYYPTESTTVHTLNITSALTASSYYVMIYGCWGN